MTDLDRLKKFCTNNHLSNDQITEIFDIIREIQADTIKQCYDKIMAYSTKRGDTKE